MQLSKLSQYMQEFSTSELKEFLGIELSNLLVEWLPIDRPIYTHENLTKIILSVYGVNVLKNAAFRERLIRSFKLSDIESFKPLLGAKAVAYNPKQIAAAVAKTSWRSNPLNSKLLEILEIPESIFDKSIEKSFSQEVIESPEEDARFFELLDYQFAMRQRILSYINSDIELAKMIVRMPTGTGKTKTAMHTIIHHYNFDLEQKGTVLWVAHTKELLEQAYGTFVNVWSHIGKGPVNTCKMWNKFDMPLDDLQDGYNGFVFCGIQKLTSIYKNDPEKFQKLAENCVLVVVDEAHRISAKKTKEAINALMSSYGTVNRSLIGLTATPGRSAVNQEENILLSSMFENKIIDIDTRILNEMNLSSTQVANTIPEKDIIKYFQEREILSKISREILSYGGLSEEEVRDVQVHLNANGHRDYTPAFLEKIAFNKARNQKILNRLIDLNSQKIPTIVFACSVEHGKMLSAALTLQGIENGHVFGEMDPVERGAVIKRFKDRKDKLNVLINYEVLTTGFDATNIRCVFITRPTNSLVLYSQMLGRGLRGPKMGGNAECLLVDIEDNLNRYSSESSAFNTFNNYWD